jgi:hypothetical protein
MPEIEVTNDQLERLDALREELASEVVGKYGHVRRRDAVEYLLDQHAGGGEDGDGSVADATAGDGGAGSDTPVDAGSHSEAGDGATPASTPGGRADGEDGDAAAAGADGETDDDGAMLDAMMNLLDEHDDRWREASDGDARYEVDLPDGSTERARTKDDVRALLFEHHR